MKRGEGAARDRRLSSGPRVPLRDRCFCIPMKDGGVLYVRAGKRPTGKTLDALQDLFAAAYRLLGGA